jgi:hypothetical protein
VCLSRASLRLDKDSEGASWAGEWVTLILQQWRSMQYASLIAMPHLQIHLDTDKPAVHTSDSSPSSYLQADTQAY